MEVFIYIFVCLVLVKPSETNVYGLVSNINKTHLCSLGKTTRKQITYIRYFTRMNSSDDETGERRYTTTLVCLRGWCRCFEIHPTNKSSGLKGECTFSK